MNKADLVKAIAKQTGVTQKEAREMLNVLMSTVAASVSQGELVRLAGFGAWGVARRRERAYRNPRTGELMRIPARRVPVFRSGKRLKKAL